MVARRNHGRDGAPCWVAIVADEEIYEADETIFINIRKKKKTTTWSYS